MNTQKSETRSPRHHDANCSLLRLAAEVLRLRHAHFSRDTGLSPTAAEELANVLEGVADGLPAFDRIDPKEATALAHRLIDDDHPELSGIWPDARPTAGGPTGT
ncbi:hypothetical protein [Streptomyces mutabilis]|uniref:hypothetical protein n=1 Tax=Streptomyces mutabilis TaxID=67332 RepID=UPI0008FB5241|nr:hypothetical protein [Streptomyces mutabilis]